MFVIHTVVEPYAPSVCVDRVHLRGERHLELVHALVRPLRAEIQTHVGLNGRHDATPTVCLVEGQVLDKEQDRNCAPSFPPLSSMSLGSADPPRSPSGSAAARGSIPLRCSRPSSRAGRRTSIIADVLIQGRLIVDVVNHWDVYHAQGDPIGCIDRVGY